MVSENIELYKVEFLCTIFKNNLIEMKNEDKYYLFIFIIYKHNFYF